MDAPASFFNGHFDQTVVPLGEIKMNTSFENCGRTWKTKELSPKTHKLWSLNMGFDKDELLCESTDILEIHRYQAMFQEAPHFMQIQYLQIEHAV